MIKVYHNPMWSKSRKSVLILNEENIDYEIINYMKIKVTKDELVEIANKLNCEPKDFIRRKDSLLKGFDDQKINDKDFMFKYIEENPKILARPIIVSKNSAIIARPPELLYDFIATLKE